MSSRDTALSGDASSGVSDSGAVALATAIAGVGPVEDAVQKVPAAAAAASPLTRAGETTASSKTTSSSNSSSSSSSSSEDDEEEYEPEGTGYSSSSEEEYADVIARLKQALSVGEEVGVQLAKQPLLPSFDLAGVSELIQSGRARRIICMCGAGISVSAGIPDFRSPGTGLYDRLQEYNLPHPHAVFELDYFRRNPRPFFLLAKELFPGNYQPTPTHHFMRLLHDKGLLLRCFTQNIDSLEHQAGLPAEAVVAAHGNFDSARCIKCRKPHDVEHVRQAVFSGDGGACYCVKKSCGGLVKPDIVFFGESLPPRFWERVPLDFDEADLLIVMGTSLVVHPFAGLIDTVGPEVPRLLVNREKAGELTSTMRQLGYSKGFDFGDGNYRDALFLGDCDAGVRQLCQLLGWEAELESLVAAGKEQWQQREAAPLAAAVAQAPVAAAEQQQREQQEGGQTAAV